MPITRRALSGLLTFLTLGGASYLVADAAGVGSGIPDRLQRALADWARLHAPSSTVTVTHVTVEDRPGGGVSLVAGVLLTWPPGLRQTPYRVEAADPEAGFEVLLASVVADLARAHGHSIT